MGSSTLFRGLGPLFVLVLSVFSSAAAQSWGDGPHEVEGDPSGPAASGTSPPATPRRGAFTSIQANVNGAGNNIVGDAANEPSIAVDPSDPNRMVIGWRQFDTIASNFREAGYAYSTDGGATWTFPGVIENGVFRSDPVLDIDANGDFYYYSLHVNGGNYICDMFKSTDGGATWPVKTPAFGGDKNWSVVDRHAMSTGVDHVYGIWQRFFNCCNEDTLTRSVDAAGSFQFPVEIPDSPTFGIVDVATNGDLWAAGIQANDQVGQNFNQFVVSKSTNAKNAAATPTFTTTLINLGGSMSFSSGPNPGGLLGQTYVRIDPSDTDRVYVLGSVNPPGSDPLDVHIVRSLDGGSSWSAPIRVNDDAPSSSGWQWFGTLSVAPDGRLDVIWNDTRNGGGDDDLNELFYAFSYDSGSTWLGNVPVSPQYDASLGYPNQSKLGDYYDMKSGPTGAHVAWAATFNGEQDVYYLNVFPDCNDNGVSDYDDISGGTSSDVDGDRIPDDCEALTLRAFPAELNLGQQVTFEFENGLPGSRGALYLTEVNGVPFFQRLTTVLMGPDGTATLNLVVPNDPSLSGIDFDLLDVGVFLDGQVALSNTVSLFIL